VTWANWFGGIYKDPRISSASSRSIRRATWRMYPEVILSPEEKRRSSRFAPDCIVGDGLAKKYGLADRRAHRHQPGIPGLRLVDYPLHDSRHLPGAAAALVDNQSMMFHWKYADERSSCKGRSAGTSTESPNPIRRRRCIGDRSEVRQLALRDQDRHRAGVLASFASMLGNLNLLLGSVALAVVLSTLFVAGNTMAMSVRERTTEIAVMRTLGFPALDDLPARRRRGAGRRRSAARWARARARR
jgi:putative ABC transport system permease protein